MAEMSRLRRRMIEDMTVRNLSPATQRSYVHAVSKFSRYFGRSPDRLDLEDVRAFQLHLVANGISWPALNRTVCALRFFYGVMLGHGEIPERIPYAREPRPRHWLFPGRDETKPIDVRCCTRPADRPAWRPAWPST
jgi:integrase/recombinase XerD